jgi:predicted nucleic acid-binding protein
MAGKLRIYMDTSVISALFDERNPERKFLTQLFLKGTQDYEAYISDLVLMEIQRTTHPGLKVEMEGIASKFPSLVITDDTEELAAEYVRYDAVPRNYPEDAYHIAIATIHGTDWLVSWNFRHIVRKKTREIVRRVNGSRGLKIIEICAPPELLEGDDDYAA